MNDTMIQDDPELATQTLAEPDNTVELHPEAMPDLPPDTDTDPAPEVDRPAPEVDSPGTPEQPAAPEPPAPPAAAPQEPEAAAEMQEPEVAEPEAAAEEGEELPLPGAGGPAAKRQYWRRILTGNPATVPAAVRKQAGADDWSMTAQQRRYRLLSTINRSWVADFTGRSREEVQEDWPRQRARLAKLLNVRDNEHEVFLGLSQEAEANPRRREAAQIAQAYYMAGLDGKDLENAEKALDKLSPQDAALARPLAEEVYNRGLAKRNDLMLLAERITNGMDAFALMDKSALSLPDALDVMPDLMGALDTLANMDEDECNTALYLAAGLARKRAPMEDMGMMERIIQAMRRGTGHLSLGVVQSMSSLASVSLSYLGRNLDSGALSHQAEQLDKRMQMLERLRHLSQDELRPLVRPEEYSSMESYVLGASEQIPAALLSCCGGTGFAALTVGAVGNSIAAARERAPLADRELQFYAGLLAGAIQASIYMNLNRMGGRLLEQSIRDLAYAGGKGLAGYSVAGLNVMRGMTTEAAKLLAAGKLAQTADMGAQEIAARLSRTASNVDWKAFGDNLTDIEANMHEAAGLLPFLLLGSGRLGLQHFRSARAIFGSGSMLERMGLSVEQIQAVRERNTEIELRQIFEMNGNLVRCFMGDMRLNLIAQRAMKLLQTDENTNLSNTEVMSRLLSAPGEEAAAAAEPNASEQTNAQDLSWMENWRSIEYAQEAYRMVNEWSYASPIAAQIEALKNAVLPETSLRTGIREIPPYLRGAESQKAVDACTSNLKAYSYLYLMNVYPIDLMRYSYKPIEEWRREAEHARQQLLGEVVKGVVSMCDGLAGEHALNSLRSVMCASCRDMEDAVIYNGEEPPKRSGRPANRTFELQGTTEVSRMMQNGVYDLAEMAPQTPEFQLLLSRGFSPGEAARVYLCKKLDIDPSYAGEGDELHIQNVTPTVEYAAQNREFFDVYRRIVGTQIEHTSKDNKEYMRGRRVDGSFTEWYESEDAVKNDIAANAALEYTELGKPAYYIGRMGVKRDKLDLMTLPEELSSQSYTKADQLCRLATADLSDLWYFSATGVQPGLSVRPDVSSVRKLPSAAYAPISSYQDGRFVASESFTSSPIAMVQTRFDTAIWRQVMSGYIDPVEMLECLEQRGYASHELLEEMQMHVEDGFDATRANCVLNPKSGMKRAADYALASAVQCATAYAVDYFIAMQHKLPQYPQRIREWLGLQAFHPEKRRTDTNRGVKKDDKVRMAKWVNAKAAGFLHERAEAIEKLREAEEKRESPDMLSNLVQDVISLDGPRNYEQGWRHFSVGHNQSGISVLTIPQYCWNILCDPLRTWKRMPDKPAKLLRSYIDKFCEKYDFFSDASKDDRTRKALTRLDVMLRKYPEMHRYSFSRTDPSRLGELVLRREPPEPRNESEFLPLGLDQRHVIRRGYEVLPVDRMPNFITEEVDGRHCLLLMDHLRAYHVEHPMADNSGIWWKGKLYGQFGARPDALRGAEVSPYPIHPLLEKLREAGSLSAAGSPQSICGTHLTGIDPDLKISRIATATTYRMPGDDARVYRLMPGDPMMDGTPLRAPYVVQSERGTYLGQDGILNMKDKLDQSFIPLHLFKPSEMRITLDAHGEKWARQSYEDAFERLLSIPWTPTEHMSYRSAYVLEYMLRLAEDSGFSRAIADRKLSELCPEEAELMNMMGDLVTVLCSRTPEPAMERLEALAERFREGKETMIPRIVDYLISLRNNSAAYNAPAPIPVELQPPTGTRRGRRRKISPDAMPYSVPEP